ncbi:MAG: type II toxin-antitoxin system VapC family toxin [Sphingomonadales bacterium]|nr:type II toxin-antitoxin system VapC family toxin [Sphingomonadales bacterium]MDE2172147.1 type II toxin-antitoxin system VapC family toxin [Sphingomonadales bacterium]
MKITADTNILVRAVVADDEAQARTAQNLLERAELVAIPIMAICEFCWVLTRAYKLPADDIAQAIRALASGDNVAVDWPAIEAGLAMLDAGGDFADGVIAHGGAWLEGETFVSFDRKAISLLRVQGKKVLLAQEG